LIPDQVASSQIETTQVMAAIPSAVWKNDENAPVGGGGLRQERIAQPFLPDRLAFDRKDFEFAAFRVECHEVVQSDGSRWTVILGLIPPQLFASVRSESVKLVAAEPTPDEQTVVGNRRSR
jgi:hypothetical protein